MNQQLNLNEYKQQIADLYSRRSQTYDDGDWHPRIAHRLVEHAHISRGQHVLDIATGTGIAAIEASLLVGSEGRVVGVDISDGMLEQARRKAEALGLSNIEFQLADAEALDFPACPKIQIVFDVYICPSTYPQSIFSQLRPANLTKMSICVVERPTTTNTNCFYLICRFD